MKLSTEELRHSHYLAGLDPDIDCSKHSILFHFNEEEYKDLEREMLEDEKDPGIRDDWRERLDWSIEDVARGYKKGHNVIIDAMNETELRLLVSRLKTEHKKLVHFANEIVVELNATQDRVAELEKKLKQVAGL